MSFAVDAIRYQIDRDSTWKSGSNMLNYHYLPMKPLHFLIVIALHLLVFATSLSAGVEKNEDGTYTISGKWTYWTERDLFAPSGRENEFGEFKTLLFKPAVNEFEGIREFKQTPATFIVRARESDTEVGDKILVVEEILSREP